MTKTKEIKKTEERIYCLPGDSTLYKIRKINNYYYRFHEDGTAGQFANCGIGYTTRREALKDLQIISYRVYGSANGKKCLLGNIISKGNAFIFASAMQKSYTDVRVV